MLLCIIKSSSWVWSFIGLIVVTVLVSVVTGYVLKLSFLSQLPAHFPPSEDVVVITLAREMIVFYGWQRVSVITGVGCFFTLSCC